MKTRKSWGYLLLVVTLVMLAWVATLLVQGATITSTSPLELAGSGVKLTNGLTWTQVGETGFGDANNVEVKSMAVFKGYLYTGNKNSITGTEIWRTADGLTWEQANTDGFGDVNNMNVFVLIPFRDYLYAATDNRTLGGGTGGEVWQTADGTTWEQVNTDGFGDANNTVAWTMAVFSDTLYVGTMNYVNGAGIWCSTDGTTWEQANTDGFGDANNVRAQSMAVFDDNLYVGAMNSATGTEIWRTADGITWTQANSDGFGSVANDGTYTLAPFGGYLYAGTRNRSTGGQLWRTTDGTTWESVITDGFGDTDNDTINVLATLGDDFYAGTARADGATTGAELWRSSDGTSWTQVNTDGFGVPTNEQINCLAALGGYYYAGVRNETIGGQVWRTETNTLEIFSWWTAGGERDGLNALVDLYVSNYPGVNVVISSSGDDLANRMISGDPPDSFQTHGGWELFDTWVEPSYMEPITQLWHDEDWLDKFPQGLIDMLSYRGEIYCVPLAVHRSNVLWYNKQIFDDNDLTPPTTFEEFFDMAASLQAAGVTPLALGNQDKWTATHLFEDVLLGVLGPDDYRRLWTGQLSFTDARVKQALETYKQVLNYVNDDHAALDWVQSIQLMLAGDAAMTIMGDWTDGLFKALGWVPDVDFGWVPSPESAGSFMVINDCFALPDNAPHLDNAINWLKTVGSVEGQDAFNPLKGSIPARTDANPGLYDVYQQSAMADYAEDEHTPSLVHGVAAPPSFIAACDDIIDNFIAEGDTEAAANALQQAALDAGFGKSGEPGVWTRYSGNPVLSPSQSWEGSSVWAPYVTKDGSTFKMWYTGNYPARIGYATSSDGITWTKLVTNPVLSPGNPGDWDEEIVAQPCVLKNDGGYRMWFLGTMFGWTTPRIGYATSPDGVTWTKYGGNPVLDLGAPGSWEEIEVAVPWVLYDNGAYKMWYTGQDIAGHYAIGYATSSDGINWTKYSGNPVLSGDMGAWDETGLLGSSILFDGTVYRMWYFGKDSSGIDRIGYATSPDGINWTKYSGNPVLDLGGSGAWDDYKVHYPRVILDGGVYKMWYSGEDGEGGCKLGYATAPEMPFVSTCTVTSTLDSGAGTLRECLENALSGQTITFDPAVFPPGAPTAIALTNPLPDVAQGHLTIDGTGAGVIIDGSGTPEDTVGISITSSGNAIKGLRILNFPGDGVAITGGAKDNTIGGDTPEERNVISGSTGDGILIRGEGSDNNTVSGNYIGTDVSGTSPLANEGNGVSIREGVQNNTVGGDTPGERNVISGNGRAGVVIEDEGTENNTITGNYIGTDISGTMALGNGPEAGVRIKNGAKSNIVGGDTPEERNIISGNETGVWITGFGTTNNIVSGNYIGTDVSGTASLANNGPGVDIREGAQNNTIGGTTAGERNVISGNNCGGVVIEDSGTGSNTVSGNYIGTDASGTTALGNIGEGILIYGGAKSNIVERNLISGNDSSGVSINGSDTMSNVVSDNLIGTDASGTADLGNGSHGIALFNGAQQNVIGEGNVIAYNKGNGVSVWNPTTLYNTITRNSIHSNSGMGIDNSDGGNAELSPPALTNVTADSVSGIAPVAYATVEIFSDDEDEGRVYEGTTAADVSGFFTLTKAAGFNGPYLTATATDADGNTSEFSMPLGVCYRIYLPLVTKNHQ